MILLRRHRKWDEAPIEVTLKATRGLLVMDLATLNRGQVTMTSTEPGPLSKLSHNTNGCLSDLRFSLYYTLKKSDKAHFWLNGYVNKQNCCIWSEANPQVYVETPLHPEKLTVWCTLWAGGILLQKR
ncbi:hypothetical protein TNCV_4813661 [Trichonephila clavipes]|nr:hypothetical protein TNCV_4813661 [Trichonephila clavipes]